MEMLSVAVDIDQTLVLTTQYPLTIGAIPIKIESHNIILFVHKRPWADSFLLELQSLFYVGIWTAATEEYAYQVLQIFPNFHPQFVFTRNQCNYYDETYAKNLGGFQGPLVLIDDDEIHKEFNIENKSKGCIINCSPFKHTDIYDQDLLYILKFIKTNLDSICDTWHKKILWVVEKNKAEIFDT